MISEFPSFHTAIFDAHCACLNLSEAEGIRLIHEAYAELSVPCRIVSAVCFCQGTG